MEIRLVLDRESVMCEMSPAERIRFGSKPKSKKPDTTYLERVEPRCSYSRSCMASLALREIEKNLERALHATAMSHADGAQFTFNCTLPPTERLVRPSTAAKYPQIEQVPRCRPVIGRAAPSALIRSTLFNSWVLDPPMLILAWARISNAGLLASARANFMRGLGRNMSLG
jgi:hypothetical protein